MRDCGRRQAMHSGATVAEEPCLLSRRPRKPDEIEMSRRATCGGKKRFRRLQCCAGRERLGLPAQSELPYKGGFQFLRQAFLGWFAKRFWKEEKALLACGLLFLRNNRIRLRPSIPSHAGHLPADFLARCSSGNAERAVLNLGCDVQ